VSNLVKMEACVCGSKQLHFCQTLEKFYAVECQECFFNGPMAEARSEAVRLWNEARSKNEATKKDYYVN
jgi:hypothetical protein